MKPNFSNVRRVLVVFKEIEPNTQIVVRTSNIECALVSDKSVIEHWAQKQCERAKTYYDKQQGIKREISYKVYA